jgi:Zn-dependent membrane protease YugP
MLVLAILGAGLLIALIFGPQFWIKWVMEKHAKEQPEFPGTGGELARHLLDKAGLEDVKLERIDGGDHYSPDEKAVRLSQRNFDGKSVTAVAVAAHEVGHALQHGDNFAPLMLRQRLASTCIIIERTGGILLMATPVVFAVTHSPVVLLVELVLGLGILASTVVIHLFTLPTEFDASFKRALPILENYLRPEDMPGARQVLKAAAFTYVASALISILNIARWLRILRF